MVARREARPTAAVAHLIVGEDSYLRTQHREEIIAANVPAEGRAFAVAQFSLERTSLLQVLSRAATPSMLSPRQVFVLSDAGAIEEGQLLHLEEYFVSPADFTVLVFEAQKLDRRTRVARLLLDHCQVHDAEPPDESGALEAAGRFAKELLVNLTRETTEDLVYILGNDQGRLRMELEKLRAYVGDNIQVTTADVAAVVSPARRFSVFDLADFLAERRRAEALARLQKLLESGESPIGIVGLLAWLYRQLLQAQALPRHIPVGKAAQTLHAPRLRVERLLRQARKFSPEELRSAFAALLEADLALKSSPANPAAVLEMLVLRLTNAQADAKA